MREDLEVRRYPGYGAWLVSKKTKRGVSRLGGVGRFLRISWAWLRGYKDPVATIGACIDHYNWLGIIPLSITRCGKTVVFVQRTKPITAAVESHYAAEEAKFEAKYPR